MTIKKFAKDNPLIFFFCFACLFAWVSWAPLILSQTGIGILPVKIPMPWVVIGTFAPFFAACVTQWLTQHNLTFFRFRFSWKHVVVGLIVGFVLIAAAFVVVPSAIVTKPPFNAWDWKAFLLYPYGIVRMIFLAAGPLGEEPGWRGFALPRLLAKYNASVASFIVGVVWFGWHLPLFLIPTWSSSPIYVFAIITISLSFVMTYIYNISRQNIAVAIAMHAIFNFSPFVLNAFLATATTKDFVPFELLFALSFLFLAIVLMVFTRGNLGYKPKVESRLV